MEEFYTDVEILLAIGEKVKELRKNKNQSQKELADFCGVNRRTIVLFEQGKGISLLSFIRIMRNFDLQDELLKLFPDGSGLDPFEIDEL